MSDTYVRTPTDITVTPLDLSALDEAMTQEYRAACPDDAEATVKVSAGFGMVDTPKGVFIFDREGVGAGPLADDDRFEIYGYAYRPGSMSLMPGIAATLTVAELRVKGIAGEPQNLAAFIRTFGVRLESNYEGMRRAIEAARS